MEQATFFFLWVPHWPRAGVSLVSGGGLCPTAVAGLAHDGGGSGHWQVQCHWSLVCPNAVTILVWQVILWHWAGTSPPLNHSDLHQALHRPLPGAAVFCFLTLILTDPLLTSARTIYFTTSIHLCLRTILAVTFIVRCFFVFEKFFYWLACPKGPSKSKGKFQYRLTYKSNTVGQTMNFVKKGGEKIHKTTRR